MPTRIVECTVVKTNETPNGKATYEEICWLVGSDGTFTASITEPPVLYPQLGSNIDGTECWYWTSAVTQLVILSRDGSLALIGEDLGPGVALDTTVGACVGIPGEDLRSVAWDYLKQWLLAEPEIELSPQSGGITGFETYRVGAHSRSDRCNADLSGRDRAASPGPRRSGGR